MKVEKNTWFFLPVERVALISGSSLNTIRRNLKKNIYSYLKKKVKINGSGVTKTFILMDENLRQLEIAHTKSHLKEFVKYEEAKMPIEGEMRNCIFCVQYADKPGMRESA